jgi:hypothetical protein
VTDLVELLLPTIDAAENRLAEPTADVAEALLALLPPGLASEVRLGPSSDLVVLVTEDEVFSVGSVYRWELVRIGRPFTFELELEPAVRVAVFGEASTDARDVDVVVSEAFADRLSLPVVGIDEGTVALVAFDDAEGER